ncbi:hypothetical protein Tco_0637316 [Tanacetum coccineum]
MIRNIKAKTVGCPKGRLEDKILVPNTRLSQRTLKLKKKILDCGDPFMVNIGPTDVPLIRKTLEDVFKTSQDTSKSSNDSTNFDSINSQWQSPPDDEIVSLEEVEIVIPEVEGIDTDILLTIKDDILREKLLNDNQSFANIEALKANPAPLIFRSVFTNKWDLASLEYSRETEGPYCTDLLTPDDIRRLLELECVMVDRTIKSQTVSLNPNQILTKELSPDMKQWEELIRENVFGLGGHRDHLPACLAHMLYCVVIEEQCNLAYFFVKRIQCARATSTANLPYGIFLTRLYRHVMETYPHLDNGIYDIVD